MRQIIAFLGSILLNGGAVFGIIYYLDTTPEKIQTVVTEAVNFDLGMMVGANTITKQPAQQSQTKQASHSMKNVSEAEPILDPVEKPSPVIKKAELKVKNRVVEKIEKRKSLKSQKKPTLKKLFPKKSNKESPKNIQRKIAQKVHVGIGLKRINTVKNQGRSKESKTGKGASKQSKRSNANTYRAGLQLAIKRIADKSYPRSARHMRKQGIVRVRFNLGRNGRISNVRVVGSSGDNALDKAATKVLIQLGRYQAPPPDFPSILIVPIRFRLI